MISETLLKKIGFAQEDIALIAAQEQKYSHLLDTLAAAYMQENGSRNKEPYTHEQFGQKRERAHSFLAKAKECCPDCDAYMAALLFWLHCVPHAEKFYAANGISETVFWDSMYDLVCKTEMCKKNYGKTGVYLDWFYLFFDYLLFGLGRLQFYIERFESDLYRFGDFELRRGDKVYSCHIPANGPLSIDACMESFQNAYEFFKDELSGPVIPITCESWLLYPPYIEKVFEKESNIAKFANLFDIIQTTETGNRFLDARNVFGRFIDGNTTDLPCRTTLQKNFIKYIGVGNTFGEGYGVLLYDGEAQRILNQHRSK